MFQLKDYVSISFISRVSTVVEEVAIGFDKKEFKKLVFDENWENKELKERTHHIAKILKQFLLPDFKYAVKQLIEISKGLEKVEFRHETIGLMFVPDFIEDYGVCYFDLSMEAIEQVTKLWSCEFAVRPFFKKYPDLMFQQVLKWTKHDDYRVRRLASEGSRPRLPWASSVEFLKDNPEKIMKIISSLYNDEHEWVRLSVANNLNDISKDYPEIVLDFAKKHINKDENTKKLLKRGLRTLLKNSNKTALELFNYRFNNNLELTDFILKDKIVKVGNDLNFSFSIKNCGKQLEKVRIEYVVYYQLFNETLSPKIYQLGDKDIKPNQTVSISRKRSFKKITTRKFYPGKHKIAIILNGKHFSELEFELEIN